jgi:hypothetical protein
LDAGNHSLAAPIFDGINLYLYQKVTPRFSALIACAQKPCVMSVSFRQLSRINEFRHSDAYWRHHTDKLGRQNHHRASLSVSTSAQRSRDDEDVPEGKMYPSFWSYESTRPATAAKTINHK